MPKPKPWFKFWRETATDAKFAPLDGGQRHVWTVLLCLTVDDEGLVEAAPGVGWTPAQLGKMAGVSTTKARKALAWFAGQDPPMIRTEEGDVIRIVNFAKRNAPPEGSAERTARYRRRRRDVTGDVTSHVTGDVTSRGDVLPHSPPTPPPQRRQKTEDRTPPVVPPHGAPSHGGTGDDDDEKTHFSLGDLGNLAGRRILAMYGDLNPDDVREFGPGRPGGPHKRWAEFLGAAKVGERFVDWARRTAAKEATVGWVAEQK